MRWAPINFRNFLLSGVYFSLGGQIARILFIAMLFDLRSTHSLCLSLAETLQHFPADVTRLLWILSQIWCVPCWWCKCFTFCCVFLDLIPCVLWLSFTHMIRSFLCECAIYISPFAAFCSNVNHSICFVAFEYLFFCCCYRCIIPLNRILATSNQKNGNIASILNGI